MTFEDSLSNYLNEVREIMLKNKALWGIDLYGPILFADPKTRTIYGNEGDEDRILERRKVLYAGKLPESVNIANTALTWGGKRWAMILLPLPDDKHSRLNLISHELFHCIQSQLNFPLSNPDNNHLDEKNGRIYLRLELEALKKAISSGSEKAMKNHLAYALAFRNTRHELFPESISSENLLELNEGLAEYTGLLLSGRNNQQILKHLNESITEFMNNKSFVRSFAYQTIPAYGYLLSKGKKYWNRDISTETNLAEYFQKSFGVTPPPLTLGMEESILKMYNGELIISEEEKREEENTQLVKSLILKFVTNPHFDLLFEKMNISFDPTNIISLDNLGSVYPTIRIADNWGILTVENGALMSPNWSKITVTEPLEQDSNIVKGDGWTLELNLEQYTILKDIYTNNYYLEKKQK
ncbi:MAG: hypothetical protein KF803_13610 [Cyclobacteriaceae bacterium]|nr:hypothetical protein [Cyclobacteriaceae bacterium]